MEQINVTGTNMVIISDKALKTFVIAGHLSERWEFTSIFEKIDDEATLDENGELFELSYVLSLEAKPKAKVNLTSSYFAEIIKVFSFIEDNKKNIFESLGIHGVLE